MQLADRCAAPPSPDAQATAAAAAQAPAAAVAAKLQSIAAVAAQGDRWLVRARRYTDVADERASCAALRGSAVLRR